MTPLNLDLPSLFKGLSDPTRLRIMNLLCEREVCVCHLTNVLKMVQPKVSRHLAYLKRMGVVNIRRDGKWIYYAWAYPCHPAARSVLHGLRDWMLTDPRMTAERRKLKLATCN